MHRKHLALQERDYALLKALSDYRYLTTSQLRGMFFSKGPFVYRRLKKLADFGLTTRLQREIVGSSAELVHALALEGARYLGQRSGRPTSIFTIHRKASRALLEHELALNAFRLAFEQAVQAQDDMLIEQWDTKHKLSIPGNKVLIPDAYVLLTTLRGRTHFFVELDRGTESASRTFRAKLQSYALYYRSGSFTRENGDKVFRVLTVTVHEQAIKTLLAASKGITPSSIFWFTHQGQVSKEIVLTGTIWKRADRPEDDTALYQE